MKDCYLDYFYEEMLELTNDTDFLGSYSVQTKSVDSLAYVYIFGTPDGIIQPRSFVKIPFKIKILKLGSVIVPISVSILGSALPALIVEVDTTGVGPSVAINTNELNWGKLQVLQPLSMNLTLCNTSPISASFSCHTVADSPVFTVNPLYGDILPGEIKEVRVTAFLDDTVKFTDVLKISITSSSIFEVPLVARGDGSTIVFDSQLRRVDFSDTFSNRECSASFIMCNKGRRTQHLSWSHASTKDPATIETQIFEVIPPRFTLKPRASQTILIKGYSNNAAVILDKLVCYSNTDKDPSRKLLLETVVHVNFINPLIKCTPESLNFNSIHTSDDSFKILGQCLTMNNTTTLPLTVNLKCLPPFSISDVESSQVILPGQDVQVMILFDPGHNSKRISIREYGKLSLSYKEHGQKDSIDLNSQVFFPNLTFDTHEVEFGCIQNQIEHRKTFKVTNSSTLVVNYQWYFIQDDNYDDITISQAFDIQPLHGKIEPGKTQEVAVSFYGHPNERLEARAVCDVAGGPKYEISLQGQASEIIYLVDKTVIDFQVLSYQTIVDHELWIQNNGAVSFDYNVIIGANSQLQTKTMISPAFGTVPKYSKQRILIRYCPCVPEDIEDEFFIRVANFEPTKVRVIGKTVFPRLSFKLPRVDQALYSSIQAAHKVSKQSDAGYEVDRLYLKDITNQFYSGQKLLSEVPLTQADKKYVGSHLLQQKSALGKKEPRSLSLSESSIVNFGVYIFDLGTVVRNTTVKKSFSVVNSGLLPLSFSLQANNLSSIGYTLEPEKVKSLPPGESQEVIVSYFARMDGPLFSEAEVDILTVGGPTMTLKLRAGIAVPEIRLNDSGTADFGELLNGFRKSMIFQIENPSAVSSDWSFQATGGDTKKIKKSLVVGIKDFEVIPSSGSLAPFGKSTVMVRFLPTEDKYYDLMLPFKISMNPKLYQFHVVGRGIVPKVIFEPSSISLGPVLPFEGVECKMTIHNPIDQPIELFSLNYDLQFKQDEETLKLYDQFLNGILYLPPRDTDIAFSDYLSDRLKKKTGTERKDESGVGELNRVSTLGCLPSSESIANTDIFASVILHGPPLSGRTTQAKKIALKYGKVYISLDQIVEKSQVYRDLVSSGSAIESTSASENIEESTKELKNWEDSKSNFSEEVVFEIIRNYFQREDKLGYRGFVVDSLECRYCSNLSHLFRIITRALLEKGRKLLVFHLTLDLSRIKEREICLRTQQSEKKLSILRVPELPEDEYDLLQVSEKDAYDLAMRIYKLKVKEIEERRHKERRHLEEEANLKAGDKKSIEDGKGPKNRRNLHSRAPTNEKNDKSILKSEKATKKTGSPKLIRKTFQEKQNEKERALEKELQEEGSEDGIVSELLLKRVEIYHSTLDAALSNFREGKESKSANQTSTESKKLKIQKVAQTEFVAPIVPDIDSHGQEETLTPEFHEFSVNSLDEEGTFKCFAALIPQMAKDESARNTEKYIPEIFVEQIFNYPPERKLTQSKVFSILSSPSAPETDLDIGENSGILLPVVSAVVAPNPGSKNIEFLKADAKKGAKSAVKVSDEKIQEIEEPEEKENSALFRWILQGNEKREVYIRFYPTDAAKTDTTLNFEIVGWPHPFQVPCAGLCQYSQIVTDPKKMFEKVRKLKDEKDVILHGEYIISTCTFEFGPLLHNKPRDKDMDRFPDNKTTINIINPGISPIQVYFGTKNDNKSDTFFFEPSTLSLPPGKSSSVAVWAYPKASSHYEDYFVISVKDNPEPFVIKLSCSGVKPELEVERRTLNFEKLLVGRNEKRELRIKNPTAMPVYWRFAGIDSLGEEFTISPIEGVIQSFQEVIVTADFKAAKPFVVKRVLKLEVMDFEKISGIVQEIPIIVTAEAYDIAMDIHFPKGLEGGLDFGTLKVSEEGKQLVTLKNKGKYEVGFRFLFDSSHYVDLITITPAQGIIQPSEKPFFVQVVFKTPSELTLKDFSILKCIVFEPSTGEVTASIPVKVSSRAVFSKFSILPARDLNFGALVHGTKSSKQFLIENTGEFDFKYSIFKLVPQAEKPLSKGRLSLKGGTRLREEPPTAFKMKKELTKQADTISFGAFGVFPTNGVVLAGTKQAVTVDFHADVPGVFDESIGVEISDRATVHNNDGLEYQLLGESCIPGINTVDFASIFEEQSVCKRLELFKMQTNVYGEEDRAFFFGAYLAGQQIQAHFKISNPFKVACEVACSAKPRGKSKVEAGDFAFEVEPKKLIIPSHEYRYVTVFFHPTSIQTYSGVFEASVENVQEGKNKVLTFDLRGEGTLPRVVVERPTMKSKTGAPLLKFRRLMVGTSQTQAIFLKNDGIIPAKMKLEWAFKDNEDIFCASLNEYHSLKAGETRSIDIRCHPSSVRKLEGELRLKVMDNSFEDSSIFLMGEGYMDDLTIEGFPDDVENELFFSDCFIGESKSLTFKLKNHSSDWLRASFAESQEFLFSPSACHIKPKGGDRDVTVTFSPRAPADIQKLVCLIKATKIKFIGSTPETEWDDRMKLVRWNNADQLIGKGNPKKVTESVAEHPTELIGVLGDFQIILNGFADYSNYECEVSKIRFKNTLMFQNRVFRFPLRNIGKVSIKFSFDVFQDEGLLVETISSPFSLSPSSGKILPSEVVMIAVRFSPTDVGDFNSYIYCKMSNLGKEMKPLVIQTSGYSLRPFCHFELEDTDPLSVESRTPERSLENGVPMVLEPNTKIIEFKSCGIRIKNIKRFYIVNPTQNSYDFQWKHESLGDSKFFKCLTPRGTVAANKKSEIVFEFSPDSLNTKESLWSFVLPEHEVRIPFLLIGYAVEPNIYINQAGVNFKSVLVGRQAKEMVELVNGEATPFAFNFNDYLGEIGNEGNPVLKFNPSSGLVPANSEISVELLFTPTTEKLFNFNLVCNVRKKPSPITINVKGEGYEIHESIQVEMNDGSYYDLGSDTESPNVLDFGLVQINDRRVKRLVISNPGKYNFDFSWKMSKRGSSITITPEIGTVLKGERVFCDLTFTPTAPIAIKDFKLACEILNGKSFPITITGSGSRPLIKLNPMSIDFGTQFVLKAGVNSITHNLEITNNDLLEMSIDTVSPENTWLELPRGIYTLAPSETKTIPITFYPREAIAYRDNLKLEINGLSIVEVPICGEGSEFRIETDTPKVNFGALRVGQNAFRTIKLFNKSKISALLNLGPASTLSTLHSLGITISNFQDTVMRPKSSITLEMKFQPTRRISQFSEDIMLEFFGISTPLYIISGACQGIEIKLENDTLPFGAVVQKSLTSRRVQLQNVGDIGAKFSWDSQKLTSNFSISPMEGYISAGMEIPLEVTFHPAEINPDIRAENISCKIEGAASLSLTLSGICIPQPAQADNLKFSTPVRTQEIKSIILNNKSSSYWHINPIIDNDSWTGPELIEVEPGQSKSYDLIFNPMDSNGSGEGSRHEGSIFFPLPDGNGILYRLNGNVDKPLPSGNISRDMPCKTGYTEILQVTNWLRRPQKFRVYTEFTKPDSSIVFKGYDFVDLSPLSTKDYKFTFYSYKEGMTNFKVIFKNETTQEYLFYNIAYKSLAPGIISTIEMTAPIRMLQTRDVIISNPLPIPVTFTGVSNNPELSVSHTIIIPAKSDGTFTIEYLPLQPKESTARVIFNSQELGLYQYDLKLNAIPSGLERSLHFKVGLGNQQIQSFRFISFSKSKIDYVCKIDSAEFSVEKTVSASAASNGGVEVSIDIFYEPSRLGDTRTQLIVSSPVGGDYTCPLFGHCISPKPQGPIIVKAGVASSVAFKNVFGVSATFNCVVDNPAFIIKAVETIPSKKTVALSIGYKQPVGNEKDSKAPPPATATVNATAAALTKISNSKTGKLTVTNTTTNTSWMYYLKYSV